MKERKNKELNLNRSLGSYNVVTNQAYFKEKGFKPAQIIFEGCTISVAFSPFKQ